MFLADNKSSLIWMDTAKSLSDQFLSEDGVVVFRKKFFVTDSFCDSSRDSTDLHMLYLEVRGVSVSLHFICPGCIV